MIISFRTDMPWQTVQTQLRLLSLIRVYTVCHSVCIVWTHYSMVEPHSSNFRVITTNFLGVRIFKKFTVSLLYQKQPLQKPGTAWDNWMVTALFKITAILDPFLVWVGWMKAAVVTNHVPVDKDNHFPDSWKILKLSLVLVSLQIEY